MRISAIAVLFVGLALCGCASRPPIPDPPASEKNAAAYRFYPGIDRHTFFAAVEEVFILADGSDFEFEYRNDGKRLTATRDWFVFLILAAGRGTDTWSVTAKEKDGGIEGHVSAYGENVVSDGSVYGTKENFGTLNTIATRNLFWDRVDYILGVRSDWPSCSTREDELEVLKDDETVHPEYWFIKGLCHMSMKDTDPETGVSTYDDANEAEEAE